MIYLYNLFLILLYACGIRAFCGISPKSRFIFCIVSFLHVGLFHALRNPYIYPDNLGYSIAFSEIGTMSLSESILSIHRYSSWGLGYVALNYVLYQISHSSMILFVSTSIMIVGGMMWLIYKFSYKPLISVCAYFIYPAIFYQSFYVLRQHLAIVSVMIAVNYLKRYKISIPFFVVAFLFHPTAIVAIPFLFFRFVNFEKLNLKMVTIAVIMFFAFRSGLDLFLTTFDRYEHYADKESTNNIVPLIMLGVLLMMHFINNSFARVKSENDENILYYLLYGFIMSIFLLGLPGGGRLAGFFIYIIPFAFPLLFKFNLKTASLKRVFTILYFCFILFLWYLNMQNFLYHEYEFFQKYI